MKKNESMSWQEAMRINNRALKLLFQHYPAMMLSRLVTVVWNALTPYVSIYLSALVINELAGDRNPDRLKVLVLITLGTAALVALVTAFLNKWNNTQNAGLFYKVDNFILQKMLDMDYVDCDATETRDKMYKIYQNQGGGGWGFFRMLGNFEALCGALLTIFGGIALTVSLFACKIPESADALVVLNHPLAMLAVILLMLAVTFIAPMLQTKADSYSAINAENHNLGNRLFGFFGWLGHKKDLATDVRIYDQNRICEKYNRNKEDIFGSNGIFAHLTQGPIGLYTAASAAVSVTFTGIAYAYVCLKALAGAFGLGSVTQYVTSITKVSGGMSSLMETLGTMRYNAPFLALIFEFLDIPNNMYQGSLTVEKRNDRKYQVEFKNVSFKYPGGENYALRKVNM